MPWLPWRPYVDILHVWNAGKESFLYVTCGLNMYCMRSPFIACFLILFGRKLMPVQSVELKPGDASWGSSSFPLVLVFQATEWIAIMTHSLFVTAVSVLEWLCNKLLFLIPNHIMAPILSCFKHVDMCLGIHLGFCLLSHSGSETFHFNYKGTLNAPGLRCLVTDSHEHVPCFTLHLAVPVNTASCWVHLYSTNYI